MIIGRRRKWKQLSFGLVVLVLIATVSLLSHLWTSAPDGQRDLLRRDRLDPEAVLLHKDIRHADPMHDSEHVTASRLDDSHAAPQGDDEITVPLDDNESAAQLDDRKNTGLEDTVRKAQDNNQPGNNQPDIVPQDGHKIAEPGGVQPDGKKQEATQNMENKSDVSQLYENKPVVAQDKVLRDSVSKDVNESDEFALQKKPQHNHTYFHGETGGKSPSEADFTMADPSMKLFRPGSAWENAHENNITELGPKSPIEANLSGNEFMDKRQEMGLRDKLRLPTLPQNEVEKVDSSARVGSFQSQVQEALTSGKDINGTKTLSENEEVQKMREKNNIRSSTNDKMTETEHDLFPTSSHEKIMSLGSKQSRGLSNIMQGQDKPFDNSNFQLQKGSVRVEQQFGKESVFIGMKNEMNRDDFKNEMNRDDFKNEMNKADFAADANQNMDFRLPTKSAFSETDGNSGSVNPTDIFDSGIKFARKNFSNFPGGVGTDASVRIVSMSLYGAEPRYTMGAIRNAELVKENFPGWRLRIYMESPASSAPRFGLVPRNIVERLRSLGVDIHLIIPEQDFIPPMMWRFLVADDLSVDYFIIRDSDSRLTERDASAVSAWIRSGKPFHSVRDHPSHASYAVSGGLWGGRTKELRDILRRSWMDLMRGTSSNYLEDMNFLNGVIWPRVQFHAYCSDSVSCDRWPNSHPFPVARYGYDHVGQVFNEHDLGRPVDIRILRTAGENSRCAPTDVS